MGYELFDDGLRTIMGCATIGSALFAVLLYIASRREAYYLHGGLKRKLRVGLVHVRIPAYSHALFVCSARLDLV